MSRAGTESNYRAYIEYKQHAVMAAKDFGYGKSVVKQIEEATSLSEISSIMRKARREMFG